ncbi:hypothetical protein [Elizabethkingia meningoseptica]|uniref:hypothetical protein n=1 Tax=Elizabethkingia meningoseptica TaxID=238 RepID=UPI002DD6AF48|nr:hypothetical protein [Elizabethkingia meningoseptica]MEC4712298.1 hypothetical protein [Elizabethkingia meningoseptica]
MAKRIVFNDEDNNELECYINQYGKVYIAIGQIDDNIQNGYITLDKEDVRELIEILSDLETQMED